MYRQWLDACLQTGIPAMTIGTAARIMAVVYLCANNENFTHNVKLRLDVEYICKRWHIGPGETVDPKFAALLKSYSREIEEHIAKHEEEAANWLQRCRSDYPQWCRDLIWERYGFKLFQ